MDNHFHLLLRQNGVRPLSGTMRSLMTSYAMRTNKKYGSVGHIFQGPYKIGRIRDASHLAERSRYIHRNPLVIGDIRTYRWSSYRQYLGLVTGFAEPAEVLRKFESKDSYATFVEND
jgi:hypothetical protein